MLPADRAGCCCGVAGHLCVPACAPTVNTIDSTNEWMTVCPLCQNGLLRLSPVLSWGEKTEGRCVAMR